MIVYSSLSCGACVCRSPSDQIATSLSATTVHAVDFHPRQTGSLPGKCWHPGLVSQRKQDITSALAAFPSNAESNALSPCSGALLCRTGQSYQPWSRQQRLHAGVTAFQHQIRSYQSVISSAARQRLDALSQRHDELCQQLSGAPLYHGLA